jgi:hypothetical protein
VYASRAGRDRREHDIAGRHREKVGVVLADSEEVDADLVGEDALLDHVSDRLRVRERAVVFVVGDIAEGVEPKDEWKRD